MQNRAPGIRSVQRRHVERHVRRAIARRLGYPDPGAVRSIDTDHDGTVLVHLNSGGNALAAAEALTAAGYTCRPCATTPPDQYGSRLVIGPGESTAEQTSNQTSSLPNEPDTRSASQAAALDRAWWDEHPSHGTHGTTHDTAAGAAHSDSTDTDGAVAGRW